MGGQALCACACPDGHVPPFNEKKLFGKNIILEKGYEHGSYTLYVGIMNVLQTQGNGSLFLTNCAKLLTSKWPKNVKKGSKTPGRRALES